jgi:methyl-accepting chemotaxis protein
MLKNLKITTQLYIAFSIVALMTFVVSVIGFNGISKTGNALVSIGDEKLPKLESLLSVQKECLSLRSSMRALLILNTDEEFRNEQLNKIESVKSNIDKGIAAFSKFELDKSENTLLENYKQSFSSALQNINTYENLAKSAGRMTNQESDTYKKMHTIAFSTLRKDIIAYESALAELVSITRTNMQAVKESSYSDISSSKTKVVIGSIIIVLISMSIGWSLSTLAIKNPMKVIISGFEKVIAGDLKDRLTITKNDELGVIGTMVNRVADERKNQILSLLDQATTINKSSQDLLKISEDSSTFSTDLSDKIQTAASSSRQISSNFEIVSTSSEEMTSSIREIAKNTMESSHITEEAKDKAAIAGEVVNRLGESSNEIGKIIKLITSVAAQTNLLALNATIEAARAGDAGKGFAVVANEVKELAKETSKATDDITNRIKMIQAESQEAITIIKEIIETINHVSDLTNMVASAIEEQSATTSEIGRSLTEALKGTNSIVESNSDIALSSYKFKDLSGGIAGSATQLQEMANKMETQLRTKFKF